MGGERMKTATDRHWNERAASVKDDIEVNLMDIFQRNLEYDYICQHLKKDMTVLEVGCGKGYSTDRFRALVEHLDAFDYAENMIDRAKARIGETNNRFFHDNVLSPQHLKGNYDAVICVRVLINLCDLNEQRLAIKNLLPLVKPKGLFILAEGFSEGFAALNDLRVMAGLPPLVPAKINFYSSVNDLMPDLLQHLTVEGEFHLGAYDYLTRVVYPMLVGAENVQHNTVFGERCQALARAHNPDSFQTFSRMRGFVLRKRC
jgi:SAM-dependent methyltransferase